MLKITLTSGLVAKKETQKKVVRALGLGKYGSTVVRADTPTIRGMLNKVHHLVTVTPMSEVKVSEAKALSGKLAAGHKAPAAKKQPPKSA